jgi:hypothetical protein
MSLTEPVLIGPGSGRSVTYGDGSTAELKIVGDESGGDSAVIEQRALTSRTRKELHMSVKHTQPLGGDEQESRMNGTHESPVEVAGEVAEVASVGLRAAEVGLVLFIGLLVSPPLLILAVVVVVPVIAIAAVVAAVVGVVAVPTLLVRRVRAHHRAHGSTVFLHRLSW